MNQFSAEGIEEDVAGGGAGDDDAVITEGEPLEGGDGLGIDGGEVGSDLEGRRCSGGGVGGPGEEEDGGAVGEDEGVSVDGAEELRGLHQPVGLPRSELAQLLARYAPQLRLVRSPSHRFFLDSALTLNKGNQMLKYLSSMCKRIVSDETKGLTTF